MSGACKVCSCTEAAACHDELTGACWWANPDATLCSHCVQPDPRRRLAMVAAAQLSEVVAELLRFVREGDQETFTAFALDPAENTADALRAIVRITGFDPDRQLDDDTKAALDERDGQIVHAVMCFLDGWA
jgi:hypothetical protein